MRGGPSELRATESLSRIEEAEPLITVTLLIYQEYIYAVKKTLVGTLPDRTKFSASRVGRWERKRVCFRNLLYQT